MKIVELPIEFEFNGIENSIFPSLIVTDSELTLIDTGYMDFLPLIEREILSHGYRMEHVKNVIITHYDDDHIGSLFELKEKYPWIKVFASEIEAKYISGEVKSERLVQAEEMLDRMPEEEKDFGKWFIQRLKSLKHVPVDVKLRDGDMILNNTCRVIATPGHTSGHISLYVPSLNSIITGDAAVKENDELVIANPPFCLHLEHAKQSLDKLKQLQAEHYYCYHGGKLTVE